MQRYEIFIYFAKSNYIKTMSKGKKIRKRITKKQLAEVLADFFQQEPNRTFSFKEIFRGLHLDTHPLKMLAIDIMEEMAW